MAAHTTPTLTGHSERSQTSGTFGMSPNQPKLICMLEVVQVPALLGGFLLGECQCLRNWRPPHVPMQVLAMCVPTGKSSTSCTSKIRAPFCIKLYHNLFRSLKNCKKKKKIKSQKDQETLQASSASESLSRDLCVSCILATGSNLSLTRLWIQMPLCRKHRGRRDKLLGATTKCKEMEGTEENQQVKKGLKDISKKRQRARISYRVRGCMLGDKARRGETRDRDAIKLRVWGGAAVQQAGRASVTEVGFAF